MTARPHIPDLIADQLAIAHADTRATLAAIARRTNGASNDDLLLAAIALLRDQAARIAGLESEVAYLGDENSRVEGEKNDIAERLTALAEELKNLPIPTEQTET